MSAISAVALPERQLDLYRAKSAAAAGKLLPTNLD